MAALLQLINALRLWPAYLGVRRNPRFEEDLQAWVEWKRCAYQRPFAQFVYLMRTYPEFRNVVYYRMGKAQYLCRFLCQPVSSLYIHCREVGGGFLVQHGFATIINAERIGRNFKVFQQVTVGYNGDQRPVLGDDVEVCCGAKVIGGIKVGNRVTIGAQALVIRDVEDDVVVGGVPAKVIKRK